MPICYEIDIEIERGPDEDLPGSVHLPHRIQVPDQLTPDQIQEAVEDFFGRWLGRIGESDPKRLLAFGRLIGWEVVSLYGC